MEVASLSATSVTTSTLLSSDSDLVARAKSGDPRALTAIAERELPRVERLLARILGPRQDLEDLVQSVFVELCRALPSFRGDSLLSTFVGGITVRVARRALRPSAFRRWRAPMPQEVEGSPALGPERETIARTRMRHLHRALEGIAPKKRIAFTLYALEGLSPKEIAELTDTKEHTVRSRIFHARKELVAAARRDPVLRELVESP
jgi:RNA polymerase sigma-70 factor (ECF subfamily)